MNKTNINLLADRLANMRAGKQGGVAFNITLWASAANSGYQSATNSRVDCGTTCCVAGFAAIVLLEQHGIDELKVGGFGEEALMHDSFRHPVTQDVVRYDDFASEWMGLTRKQSEPLYHPYKWFVHNYEAYGMTSLCATLCSCITPALAAETLRELARTGKTSWDHALRAMSVNTFWQEAFKIPAPPAIVAAAGVRALMATPRAEPIPY